MSQPPLDALEADVADLAASLHLLADAADKRGDSDAHGALRLLARYAEGIVEQVERLTTANREARP